MPVRIVHVFVHVQVLTCVVCMYACVYVCIGIGRHVSCMCVRACGAVSFLCGCVKWHSTHCVLWLHAYIVYYMHRASLK